MSRSRGNRPSSVSNAGLIVGGLAVACVVAVVIAKQNDPAAMPASAGGGVVTNPPPGAAPAAGATVPRGSGAIHHPQPATLVAPSFPSQQPQRSTTAGDRDKPSDWDKAPREGEDFFAWALRVIKGNNPFSSKQALMELRLREVEPDRLDEVSDVLVATLKDSRNFDDHIEAMLVWRTEETDRAILALGGSFEAWANSGPLMNALVKLGTRDAARALASGMTEFRVGEQVVPRLIEMGPIAEEFVAPFLDNTDARVRTRAYNVLSEIGTRQSLNKLRGNIGKERNAQLKDLAKRTFDTVKQRVDAEQGTGPRADKTGGRS